MPEAGHWVGLHSSSLLLPPLFFSSPFHTHIRRRAQTPSLAVLPTLALAPHHTHHFCLGFSTRPLPLCFALLCSALLCSALLCSALCRPRAREMIKMMPVCLSVSLSLSLSRPLLLPLPLPLPLPRPLPLGLFHSSLFNSKCDRRREPRIDKKNVYAHLVSLQPTNNQPDRQTARQPASQSIVLRLG